MMCKIVKKRLKKKGTLQFADLRRILETFNAENRRAYMWILTYIQTFVTNVRVQFTYDRIVTICSHDEILDFRRKRVECTFDLAEMSVATWRRLENAKSAQIRILGAN